jgi:tetratricopeptide (TPR) repeat protein
MNRMMVYYFMFEFVESDLFNTFLHDHSYVQESSEALKLYKMTVSIYRDTYGDDSLIVARMLNQVGLSASLSHSTENLEWALLALKEAIHIRLKYLGPHHVDVVDTMNNIAGVFLHKREMEVAKELYADVMLVRAYIFGKDHPSVAVTAQTLGKVYTRLSDFQNAMKHYELALEIYQGEVMKLASSHPLVVKVRDELVRVERIVMVGRNAR